MAVKIKFLNKLPYTPFNNSLVRTRPALSRKILSLWMARAKLARAWPALFWCCFYQHQSSARPAPGADQRVSERSSARPGPKFLARSKVTRFPGEANELYRSTSALYMACPVTMTVIPLVAGFVNGLLKVARLCWLFVNAIFYCLARTILARTWCGPKMMSYWKGYYFPKVKCRTLKVVLVLGHICKALWGVLKSNKLIVSNCNMKWQFMMASYKIV